MNRHELASFILSFAEKTGMETFREQAAGEIVRITRPYDAVPDIYSEYRQIIHDGIVFLLSNFSPARLTAIVADQLLMEENSPVQERLIRLVRQVPTLNDQVLGLLPSSFLIQIAITEYSPENRVSSIQFVASLSHWMHANAE